MNSKCKFLKERFGFNDQLGGIVTSVTDEIITNTGCIYSLEMYH